MRPLAALSGALAVPLPAATHWAGEWPASRTCYGSQAGRCDADNGLHVYDWDLGPRFAAATFRTLYESYDTTALNISQSSNGVNNGSHTSQVDVHYEYGSTSGGAAAVASCYAGNGSNFCQHWHVIYDADAIAGVDADVGEVEDFFTTSTECSPTDDAPEVGEPATFVEGPDGHMFAEGDELILSLTPANETGERELTTNHSFFLVSDGELDPGLAEWRRRCAEGALRPLFAEAQELGLDDLVTRMQSIDQ